MTGLSDRLDGLMVEINQMVSAVEPDSIRSAVESANTFMKRAADASSSFQSIIDSTNKAATTIAEF